MVKIRGFTVCEGVIFLLWPILFFYSITMEQWTRAVSIRTGLLAEVSESIRDTLVVYFRLSLYPYNQRIINYAHLNRSDPIMSLHCVAYPVVSELLPGHQSTNPVDPPNTLETDSGSCCQ